MIKRTAWALLGIASATLGQAAPPTANWEVPNWGTILTQHGAVKPWVDRIWCGHSQGMCVSSNAIYFSFHNEIVKTDWYGRLLKRVEVDRHGGDICLWNGRLYTGVCFVPKKGSGGRSYAAIYVYDAETLELLRKCKLPWDCADGITCLDGVIYLGMGNDKGKRKNWYGKYDAVTLEPLCKTFGVDDEDGSDCGAQNMCTDGTYIYVSHYTSDPAANNVIVHDRKDFKVVAKYQFGYNNGLDVVPGGGDGAVRFACCFTPNWGNSLQPDWKNRPDPPPLAVQGAVQFGELKAGRFTDITFYGDAASRMRSQPKSRK